MAKRDSRLDAIKYQEMLKAQQAGRKRASEDQAKEEVDKLSRLIAGMRQLGMQGTEAESELDKANAALREKDWTKAFNAADGGNAVALAIAAASCKTQGESAAQMVYAVENIGVAPEEMLPKLQEGRAMEAQGRFLEGIRKFMETKAKALELGRAHMEETIGNFNGLVEEDRRKGVDITGATALIDKARRAMEGGDVDFNHVINLITVEAYAALENARAGGAGVSGDGSARQAAEAQDIEAVKRAIEDSFHIAKEEIATAKALKANVSAPEKELGKATSAFDGQDFKGARAYARRSIVSAQMVARKAVMAMLLAASQEVRRLRLAGVNVTEPRKTLAMAKARMSEGAFRESYEMLDELVKRTATMREEQQKIIKEVDGTYDQLLKLTDTLLVPLDAVEALEEARNHARRGDVERAHASIKRAMTAGREFWTTVVNAYTADVRSLVLESGKMGGRIPNIRVVLNAAKQALDEGRFQDAINKTSEAVRNLEGTSPGYLQALNLAAAKTLDIKIAGKLGVLQQAHEKALSESDALRSSMAGEDGPEKSPEALKADLAKHKESLEVIKYDFKAEQDRFQRVVRRTLELENEVEEGKKIGTDMGAAEELLFNSRAQLNKRRFGAVEDLLKQIEADITQRKDARIDELLRDADTDLKHLRAGGVYVEDCEREISQARQQHANRNYEVAVDLIQDAISSALELQQDLDAARREMERAESLLEQATAYGADTTVASGLLDDARSASREHDDRDARAMSAQAVGELQTDLAKYIELILESAEKEIDAAESEHGDFPEARQRLSEARRLRESGDVGDAIVMARDIAAGLRQSLQLIQEIRQKIDLVEALIASASQYSKTVVMPHKLLEHAKERLANRSLEAAREAVNEALQKAEENWRIMLRGVHRDAFELIDDYENKGVQLTAARNMMMQAQGLLETKNFQESHRIAMVAQETARKSFDIFTRTQRAVGELEEEVQALQGFGVDAAPLTEALEQASAAFTEERYDDAMAAITRAQEVAPALKTKRADELQTAVSKVLDGAKGRKGLNHKRFKEAFDHCLETRKEGDLSLTIEMLLETERDLSAAMRESDAVEALLTLAESRAAEFARIGLDTKALEAGRLNSVRRLDALDLKEGTSILKRALKTAEKEAAAFSAAKIDALVQEALAMRLRGYPSEGIIKSAEAGSEALLAGDFARAVAAAAAGADDLQAIPLRADAVRRDAARARHAARLLNDAYGAAVEPAGPEVERMIAAGDLEGAESAARALLGASVSALAEAVENRLAEVEGSVQGAEDEGAATAPAQEAIQLARTALEQGIPEAASHWARLGADELTRARSDSKAAAAAIERARAIVKDVAAFGAATGELEPKVKGLEEMLKARRHRTLLAGLAEIERVGNGAKKERFDARKSEVLAALQRAAKLGLPQDQPRKDLAAAERLAAEGKFEEAVRALEALEADTAERLSRRDDISAQFEEVSDLVDGFADMKVDFKSADESRAHARTAIEKFQLKEADELTQLFKKEVGAILTSHTLGRIQAYVKAAGAAKAEGINITELEEHARAAEDELKGERHREALFIVDQGMAKLAETRKAFADVTKILKEEEAQIARAAPLKVDLGEAQTALASARAKLQEGALAEAKIDADYGAGARRSQVAAEVERRGEALMTAIEDAAAEGISIEAERASMKRWREAAEGSDFAKLVETEAQVTATLEKKAEERRLAVDARERTQAFLERVAELGVPVSEFEQERKAAAKVLDANDFKRGGQAFDALLQKVTQRAKARAEAEIADTTTMLKTCQKSKVDTGAASDQLAQARRLADGGDFLQAIEVVRAAEKAAYEHKDIHDRASQVVRFLEDNLQVAQRYSLDASSIEGLRSQAQDAFEFQSYAEAAGHALEALGALNGMLREAFEQRRHDAERRLEELEMGGATVGILRRELEFAQTLAGSDDFVTSEIQLSGTDKRIGRLAEEFASAKEGQDRLSTLIDVADLLGVDARAARKAGEDAQSLFDEGKYTDTRKAALAGRSELAKSCATEVHKRLDAAAKVLEELDLASVPTAALTDLLDRATSEVIDEDFTGAFATAREVLEGADRQRRAHEAARSAIRAAKRLVKIVESVEADASSASEMASEAALLFASGDFEGSRATATQAIEAGAQAASASAGLAIEAAEANVSKFGESGVRCAPAEDSLSRSREALELADYLGSIRFARQASRLADDARKQMGEAEKLMDEAQRAFERAEGLVEIGDEERKSLDQARHDFESGQMLRALQQAKNARAGLDRRAKDGIEKTRAEVNKTLASLVKLRGDPAPTQAELKEADKALSEGRAVDALEGVVGARTFAREMVGEAITARRQEMEALVERAEAAGADAGAAKAPIAALGDAYDALDAEGAVALLAKAKEAVDRAVKVKAEGLLNAIQKASEHRFFKTGAGAQEAAQWRQMREDMRAQLAKGDSERVLAGLGPAVEKLEAGIAAVVAERLVEIDAIRDAHGSRRTTTEAEHALYSQVADAADRGRATLEDLDAAGKLDQTLKDASSKFVTDARNNINREMMSFEDKAAVEKLKVLLAAVDKVRANPAAAVAKTYEMLDGASALLTARAQGLLKAADRQLEVARAIELDASALQDFADRAHAALQEGKVTDAIEFADNVLKESARLQEAHVTEFRKRVVAEYDAAPEGKAKGEAKRLLAESAAGLKMRDFEAAYDFARKGLESMVNEAKEAAEAAIQGLLTSVETLEGAGVDCTEFRDGIEEVRTAFDQADGIRGRKRLAEVTAVVKQRKSEWERASELIARMESRVERANAAKIEAGDLTQRLNEARRKLKDADFAGVKKDADASEAKSNDLFSAKTKALQSSAQAKVKHNKNLEIDSRAAEELLASSQKMLAAKDMEGALEAAIRAIAEADGAKEVTKQVRALGEQGTELLERAAEAGVTLSHEQEQVIFDAAKGRLKAGIKVQQLEALIQLVREQIGVGGPRLELSFAVGEPPVVNRTNNAVLEVANRGDATARDLAIQFSGDASVRIVGDPPSSLEPGDRSDLELQVLSRRMGDIAVRVLLIYKDDLTGETKRRTDRRWVTFFDPTDITAVEQFVRREEKCIVCVGAIPPSERLKVCECNSTLHLHCAAELKDCPKCGRPLTDS